MHLKRLNVSDSLIISTVSIVTEPVKIDVSSVGSPSKLTRKR